MPRNRRFILRVEELQPRTVPAVLDPAAVAASGDDGTADPDTLLRCGSFADLVAEDDTPLDDEMVPDEGEATPDDMILWITIVDEPAVGDGDGTDGVFTTTDEVTMTEFDPAICYMVDLPPDVAGGDTGETEFGPAVCYFADLPPESAGGDTGSQAGAGPVFLFSPSQPIDLPDPAPGTDEIDPAVGADDTTGPPPTKTRVPDTTGAGQQVLLPTLPPDDTADALLDLDADGADSALGEFAGGNA